MINLSKLEKFEWAFVLLAATLVLSACGGGDGGGLASTPAPLPTPSPSPSPKPSGTGIPAATTYDLENGVKAAVSNAVIPTRSLPMHAVIAHARGTAGNLGEAVVWPAYGNAISIGRDDHDGYVIELPLIEFLTYFDGEAVGATRTSFAANTRFSYPGEHRETYAARATAQSTNARGDNRLFLDHSRLNYATFGHVASCRVASASECTQPSEQQFAAFVFGQVTPAGEIPLSGSAGYSGRFEAADANGSELFPSVNIAGDARLSIDFARTAVAGQLFNIRGHQDDALTSGRFFALPDYVVDGALKPGGLLEGRLLPAANSDGWIAGAWSASFYGPAAAEIGAVLNLPNASDDTPLYGTLAAKRDGP